MNKKIVITGSVAYDYLMRFPGRFSDVVVPDKLHRLSVSFLVDEMRKVRGGVAPNIAYNLALLGAPGAILATAGADAHDYRAWLEEEGVDVSGLMICEDLFTASFLVSTDLDQSQIATFYAGAMARASNLSFDHFGKEAIEIALIGPNDPAAMSNHARECREKGIAFAYDPSQQIARISKEEILEGLTGASIFLGNEYEFGALEKKTELTEKDLIARIPVVVKTLGSEGSRITVRTGAGKIEEFSIPVAKLRSEALDPTGVGDAYRAGLLACRGLGLPWDVAGRAGALAAAFSLEHPGPQPRRYSPELFLERYTESFQRSAREDGLERLWTRS